MQLKFAFLLLLGLLPMLMKQAEAGVARCDGLGSNSRGWIEHSGSCYRWTESPDYWYEAERACNTDQGHLVSIGDQTENILVGRLTYCKPAWIGRYGTHADRRADPDSYRWTDNSPALAFHRHNFSRISSPHQPLVTAEDLQWFNQVYHSRQTYVCKAPVGPSSKDSASSSNGCPSGWYSFGDYCYLQPGFKATYIEADFYCRGRGAHLASVHTASELRLLNLLDLSEPVCSLELWLGLVKLNPCRIDYFHGRRQQICYRWSDRSGNHTDFPAWARGNPNGDLVTNCVLLRDRDLHSAPCHLRRSFVCKRPKNVGPTPPPTEPPRPPTQSPSAEIETPTQPPTRPPTEPPRPPTQSPTAETETPMQPPTRPPTQSPETSKIQAAYDFRRLASPGENLARPGRFRVKDWGDAALVGGARGAMLNGSRGILIDTQDGALTRQLKQNRDWTIFYYVQRPEKGREDYLLADVSGPAGEPGLALVENQKSSDLSMYNSAGYFRDESDPNKDSINPADPEGLRAAVVMSSARQATFYRNGVDASTNSPATADHAYPDNDSVLMLGNAYQSALTGYKGWLACFGVAHAALSRQELADAFRTYCP